MQLIPFGIRQGLVVHIGEVDRGLDCDCVCPECGAPLMARKGVIREPHFAHYREAKHQRCGSGYETLMHRFAKQVIAEAGYLALPGFEAKFEPPDDDLSFLIAPKRAMFHRVEIEERMALARRRVDVVGYEDDGRILIEVCVTHRVRGKKLKEVQRASEAMVEITLQKHALFADSSDDLRKEILDQIDNKRWIFHPEGELKFQEVTRTAKEREGQRRREAFRNLHREPIRNTQHELFEKTVKALVPPSGPVKANIGPGHVPSRESYTPDDYVRAMEQFLVNARYDDATRLRVIKALIVAGNITKADLALAHIYGLEFAKLAD